MLTVKRQLSGRVALWWRRGWVLLWDILPSARKTEKQVAISGELTELEKQGSQFLVGQRRKHYYFRSKVTKSTPRIS